MRAQVRGEVTYHPSHTYNSLAEFEIELKGREVELDMDYFGERELIESNVYNHPLDPGALRELSQAPLPTMKLNALKEFLVPRPCWDKGDEGSSRGSIHS